MRSSVTVTLPWRDGHIRNMRRGLMKWLRVQGRLPSLLLLFAILAPVVFGSIPANAEQRLVRDLSYNICAQNQDGPSGERAPASHEHCCILCGPAGHVFGTAAATPVLILPPLNIRSIDAVLAASEIPLPPPDLRATAPRGPPAV
jgi:hypothetical protein